MPTLRTTINPTEEITVDDREATDLDAMGLVLKGTRATTDEGLTAAAVRQVTGAPPDETPVVSTTTKKATAPRKRTPKKAAATARTAAPDTSTTSTTSDGNTAVGDNGGDADTEKG